MRSLEEILRTYNIVNSRAVSRYTIRFTAVLLLAGAGVVAGSMLITSPDLASDPAYRGAQGAGDGAVKDGAEEADPLEIITTEGADWVYIGYPPERYDPALKDQYDGFTIEQAVLDWLAAHPTRLIGQPYEAIHEPESGTLMGYRLHFA